MFHIIYMYEKANDKCQMDCFFSVATKLINKKAKATHNDDAQNCSNFILADCAMSERPFIFFHSFTRFALVV